MHCSDLKALRPVISRLCLIIFSFVFKSHDVNASFPHCHQAKRPPLSSTGMPSYCSPSAPSPSPHLKFATPTAFPTGICSKQRKTGETKESRRTISLVVNWKSRRKISLVVNWKSMTAPLVPNKATALMKKLTIGFSFQSTGILS